MSDLHDKARALPEQMRKAATGVVEWRVQDEAGAYIISFNRLSSISPEHEARAWFAQHSKNYPESAAKYEVARCVVLDASDRLLIEAADTIAALLAENERLKEGNRILHLNAVADHERAKTAEERYAELCEAEPVALLCVDGDHRCLMCDDDAALNALPHGTSLIPRPSMEGKP